MSGNAVEGIPLAGYYQQESSSERVRKSAKGKIIFAGVATVAAVIFFVAITGESSSGVVLERRAADTTDVSLGYTGPTGVSNHLERRFTWALAVTLISVAVTAINLYLTINACIQWAADYQANKSAFNDATGCIMGAIGTLLTVAGAGIAFWNGVRTGLATVDANIANHAIEMGTISAAHKRADQYSNITQQVANATGMQYNFHSLIGQNSSAAHMIPANQTQWPIFQITNPDGFALHHTFKINEDGSVAHRFGHLPPTNGSNSTNAKRDDFNTEAFSSGGLDMKQCAGDGKEHLNMGDFDTVKDKVTCALKGTDFKTTQGFDTEMIDDGGSIIAQANIDAVAADGSTTFNGDQQCKTGLPKSKCGSSGSTG